MNKINAEIIADSVNETGQRITTFIVVFPRIVLAEFNTHRMLSRNSASSRAIPFETMLKRLETEPFVPIKFQKDHSGMQGTEYFEGEEEESAKHHWNCAKNNAIAVAKQMSEAGITKQLCNRILEPFMYHTVIVTGTDWENFFKLRAHPAAEIHIQDLAHKMLHIYNESEPKRLALGEWHIPFGEQIDQKRFKETFNYDKKKDLWYLSDEPTRYYSNNDLKISIATARCARVSYLNYEGKDDYAADVKLYERLSTLGHWSPFEHCASASGAIRSGNYAGFLQLRKTFKGENADDPRVLKV